MAGLLSQGASQRPQQPRQQAQGQPPQPEPRAPQPSQPQAGRQPQQGDPRTDTDPQAGQQQYNTLVESMLRYLYDKGAQQVERALTQGDDIVQRMATVISTIMLTHYHALAADGKTVPPGVMFQAGMELSKAVGEMAVEMGRLSANEGEPIEAAFMGAIGRFGQLIQDGAMTQEQRQRYAQLIRAMRQIKQDAGGQTPPRNAQPQGGA
ncbi:hypothetical protein [Chromohalobacter canadensis]|uniref:hypothetical protein n=1 Tax=Chromohalobacter canadensis TaxID=141389 RepID=UPI00240FE6A3|nr:hypothetical protein [Chromohalobacter canadensis]